MPLLVDRGSDPRIATAAAGCVEIGLLNNMPDAAWRRPSGSSSG